jgi:hypothetical protein
VKDNGREFERVLKEREKNNSKFGFLFDQESPDYHVYQLAIDPRYRVPTPPPDTFADEGYASMYSSDSAEDSEKERVPKGNLGKLARKRFEAMLRSISGKRVEVARAMEFAMNHAMAADEVVAIICQSLVVDDTPVPRKLARLHLVSDILHNAVSLAMAVRSGVEERVADALCRHLHYPMYGNIDWLLKSVYLRYLPTCLGCTTACTRTLARLPQMSSNLKFALCSMSGRDGASASGVGSDES